MKKRKSFVGVPIHGRIFINPGTGPVENADVGHARQNISQLILDAGFSLDEVAVSRDDSNERGDGRFRFILTKGEFSCDVLMPGLDLSEVRYLDSSSQNAWDFPRLYVDGSSWLWKFAIGCVTDSLLNLTE